METPAAAIGAAHIASQLTATHCRTPAWRGGPGKSVSNRGRGRSDLRQCPRLAHPLNDCDSTVPPLGGGVHEVGRTVPPLGESVPPLRVHCAGTRAECAATWAECAGTRSRLLPTRGPKCNWYKEIVPALGETVHPLGETVQLLGETVSPVGVECARTRGALCRQLGRLCIHSGCSVQLVGVVPPAAVACPLREGGPGRMPKRRQADLPHKVAAPPPCMGHAPGKE